MIKKQDFNLDGDTQDDSVKSSDKSTQEQGSSTNDGVDCFPLDLDNDNNTKTTDVSAVGDAKPDQASAPSDEHNIQDDPSIPSTSDTSTESSVKGSVDDSRGESKGKEEESGKEEGGESKPKEDCNLEESYKELFDPIKESNIGFRSRLVKTVRTKDYMRLLLISFSKKFYDEPSVMELDDLIKRLGFSEYSNHSYQDTVFQNVLLALGFTKQRSVDNKKMYKLPSVDKLNHAIRAFNSEQNHRFKTFGMPPLLIDSIPLKGACDE